MTAEEKTTADKRHGMVKVPINFSVISTTLFTRICGGVKSHTWLQLYTKRILSFCLRGLLCDQQRVAFFKFLGLLEQLFSPVFDTEYQDSFHTQWHQAIAEMERAFPASLQTFVFHLLYHLPGYFQLYGPPSNFWMFPYERFNHTLSSSITNNQHPEISSVKKNGDPVVGDNVRQCWVHGTTTSNQQSSDPLQVPNSRTLLSFNQTTNSFGGTAHQETSGKLYAISQRQRLPLCHSRPKQFQGQHIRDKTFREKASVVKVGNHICRIQYFLGMTEPHLELAVLQSYGVPQQCSESHCKFVPLSNTTDIVAGVTEMSAPLIHVLDREFLWIV